MIKIVRETPKRPKEETQEEKVKRLEQEVDTLKLALDEIVLNGGVI